VSPPPTHGNLFANLPTAPEAAERLDLLVKRSGCRIERIVSTGQASPPGFWYDQPNDEFVVLLAGAAILRLENGSQTVALEPGDWIELPAHCRHRVEATQIDPPTVWLAVHVGTER
jgi:cupin 2 domain-containing protein